jgi:hypothetical protein
MEKQNTDASQKWDNGSSYSKLIMTVHKQGNLAPIYKNEIFTQSFL